MNGATSNPKCVQILMKSDAEIWAFWAAITQGNIAAAQEYLHGGGGIDDMPSDFHYTALYRTIHMRYEKGYLNWMKFLLDSGADPNHPQGELHPTAPLFLSVGHNIFDGTKLLLEYGANPNLLIGGGTCLHISVINPRVDMLQLLLDYSADFSIKDEDGKLPLDSFEEWLEYRRKMRPNFTNFEDEPLIRQMISPLSSK